MWEEINKGKYLESLWKVNNIFTSSLPTSVLSREASMG